MPLTPEDVRTIRKEYKLENVEGKYKATSLVKLSQRYGISQGTIRKVAKRQRYAWVND